MEDKIMSAYLIGHIKVKNETYWQTYLEGVSKSLLPYKAEVVFRGRLFRVLAGKHSHENTVVIRFPDQDTLQTWYNSEAYQALIPIRDKGADVVIVSYDV